MALPRILLVVPLIAAGVWLPAAAADPKPAPSGALGMEHEYFATDHVTVKCGDTLSMVNDSRFVHIIGAGSGGSIATPPKGVPVSLYTMVETNDSYTTGKWNVPGKYSLTCSVHPAMTVEVVVPDCCC